MNPLSILSPRNGYDYSPTRRFNTWQSEYDRLLSEEAVLRRKLHSLDSESGMLAKRLDLIQTRMVELQYLTEQKS